MDHAGSNNNSSGSGNTSCDSSRSGGSLNLEIRNSGGSIFRALDSPFVFNVIITSLSYTNANTDPCTATVMTHQRSIAPDNFWVISLIVVIWLGSVKSSESIFIVAGLITVLGSITKDFVFVIIFGKTIQISFWISDGCWCFKHVLGAMNIVELSLLADEIMNLGFHYGHVLTLLVGVNT